MMKTSFVPKRAGRRMLTLSLVALFCTLAGLSCAAAPKPWTGTWQGTAIIVNVEYTFTDNSFEMKTTSANNVMVAAAKGPMRVEGDTMYITETDRYNFDTATNKGAWGASKDSYEVAFKINGTQMSFQPKTSAIAIQLTKQ